jgi:hypothetical protein
MTAGLLPALQVLTAKSSGGAELEISHHPGQASKHLGISKTHSACIITPGTLKNNTGVGGRSMPLSFQVYLWFWKSHPPPSLPPTMV